MANSERKPTWLEIRDALEVSEDRLLSADLLHIDRRCFATIRGEPVGDVVSYFRGLSFTSGVADEDGSHGCSVPHKFAASITT